MPRDPALVPRAERPQVDAGKTIAKIRAGAYDVVGGTAWVWPREEPAESIDVLFAGADPHGERVLPVPRARALGWGRMINSTKGVTSTAKAQPAKPTLRNPDQPDAAGALQDLSLLVELGVAPEQVREAGPKPRKVG